MISVLILTRNEAHDLPGCLASVGWSDDIHVLDSYSTDTTARLAQAAGVHLHQRAFDHYASQRNFGLDLPFAHPWLLILDADERIPLGLADEMRARTAATGQEGSAFRLRRRDFLFNTWLKHAQLSPFYIRLVRPTRVRYTRTVNEVLEVNGAIGDLTNPFDHFPFSKGIAHWISKHNQYSTMEAEIIHSGAGVRDPSLRTALSGPDFHTRRLHQKALFYRLPGRPLIKWLYLVFVRGAFLDGAAGMTYATLAAFYEYLIVIKTKEARLAESLKQQPQAVPSSSEL